MTRDDLNYLNMSRGVMAHMEGFAAKWNKFEVIKEEVALILGLNNDIGNTAQGQAEKDPTGLTKNKDIQFDLVTSLSLKLAHKVAAYALSINDKSLLTAVDYSKSSLLESTEMDVINKCQIIVNKGREFLEKLTKYNITKQELDDLQKAIDDFKKMPAQRDARLGERKTATKTIPELVNLLREEYKKLDKMVYGMLDDDEFESTYRSLRSINSQGGRSKKKDDGPGF